MALKSPDAVKVTCEYIHRGPGVLILWFIRKSKFYILSISILSDLVIFFISEFNGLRVKGVTNQRNLIEFKKTFFQVGAP